MRTVGPADHMVGGPNFMLPASCAPGCGHSLRAPELGLRFAGGLRSAGELGPCTGCSGLHRAAVELINDGGETLHRLTAFDFQRGGEHPIRLGEV